MSYSPRSHLTTGEVVPASDYNQGIDNEIELAIGGASMLFSNGGADIVADTQIEFDVPYKAKIDRVRCFAGDFDGAGGTIEFDIFKTTYSSFDGSVVPGTAESICGTVLPGFSGSYKYEDSTLTSWTTDVVAGDILRVRVNSCSGIQQCTFSLKWSRS